VSSSMTKLAGRSLIGFREGAGTGDAVYAVNPATGERLQPGFIPATAEDVDLAVRLAAEAFEVYRRVSGRDRGAFLRAVAAKIEAIAGDVIERAAGTAARGNGAHLRAASIVCAGRGRGIVGAGAHRPRRSGSQACAEAGHSVDAATAGAGGGVWCE